mmetsp:Transcript_17791/g.36887  ORF Transcript_17791/g.36887 Transcript_17791/m.36887 type:complete len:511 (+) Transcript_17791:1533-3065(+)
MGWTIQRMATRMVILMVHKMVAIAVHTAPRRNRPWTLSTTPDPSKNSNRTTTTTTTTQFRWHVAALARDQARNVNANRKSSSRILGTALSDSETTGDDYSSSSLPPPSPFAFTTHSSISELLKEFDYDAFILDQFGVLHNGKDPLEGAVDCIQSIVAKNGREGNDEHENRHNIRKRLLLTVLSNTSSPAKTTLDRLHNKLGFDRSNFIGAVTSGEEAARYIRETFGTKSKETKPTKSKFVWCTWDPSNENVPDPLEFLELCGPNIEPTIDVDRADFVVAHGSGAIRGYSGDGRDDDNINDNSDEHKQTRPMVIRSMGNFMDDGNLGEGTPIHDLLEACARRNLPMVCANPDEVVMYHDGSLKHMPGKIAKTYESIAEERNNNNDNNDNDNAPTNIRIFGKPHKEHFEACLRELELAHNKYKDESDDQKRQQRSSSSPPLRVAHVGDSLHHDVAGANAAGVASIFILGGIHATEFEEKGTGSGMLPTREALAEFFEREGHTPTHVVPLFRF